MLTLNQELINDPANQLFSTIIKNEEYVTKADTDTENGMLLLSESGLYEFTEEWDNNTVCQIKKIA